MEPPNDIRKNKTEISEHCPPLRAPVKSCQPAMSLHLKPLGQLHLSTGVAENEIPLG